MTKKNIVTARLVSLRNELGFGVRQMARELGVCASTVCYWEKGSKYPDVISCHKIIRLAEKNGIEVTMDYLRPIDENEC